MKTTTQKLTEWAISKIKSDYPEDVALLVAVEGLSVNGDGHGECFDYYVPATERGLELGRTFIIGGIGHDLSPHMGTHRRTRTSMIGKLCLQCEDPLQPHKEDERISALRKKLR